MRIFLIFTFCGNELQDIVTILSFRVTIVHVEIGYFTPRFRAGDNPHTLLTEIYSILINTQIADLIILVNYE